MSKEILRKNPFKAISYQNNLKMYVYVQLHQKIIDNACMHVRVHTESNIIASSNVQKVTELATYVCTVQLLHTYILFTYFN